MISVQRVFRLITISTQLWIYKANRFVHKFMITYVWDFASWRTLKSDILLILFRRSIAMSVQTDGFETLRKRIHDVQTVPR